MSVYQTSIAQVSEGDSPLISNKIAGYTSHVIASS